MKNSTFKKYFVLLCLCFVTPFLFTGCSEKIEEPVLPPSVTPSANKLAKSAFVAFTQKLDSMPVVERDAAVQEFLTRHPSSPVIEGSSLACFFWYGKAVTVTIMGDIQMAWAGQDTMKVINCGDSTFFYKVYSLPEDARIDYLYLVDGFETTDPRNPIITPSGYGNHSQCAMPAFIPDIIRNYNPNIKHGTLDSLKFGSVSTPIGSRTIKIYKPFGFDSLKNLPSLYINDGLKAIEYCSYINILDNLIASGKIAPVIVVFIEYKEGDQDFFLNKTEEYSAFICDTLVPFIDLKFRTINSPEKRGIAGISAGGHISLITALKRPDKFLRASGQSSTLTPEFFEFLENLKVDVRTSTKWRLYFDVGRYDLLNGTYKDMSFLSSNQLLDKKISELNLEHKFNIFNDGHQWANWRERTDDILIYFFRN